MRPNIYKEIFRYAEKYIEEKSIYLPEVRQNTPTESNVFPLVIIPKCKIILDDETLKYGEQKYQIIFEIEIYATDKTVSAKRISSQTIINELLDLVYEVFENQLGMWGKEPQPKPNADTNISRVGIMFTGKIKDNKIYRR